MGRLLFWGLIVLCVLLALRLALRGNPKAAPETTHKSPAQKSRHPSRRPHADAPAETPTTSLPMVQCAHCGVYLPRADALQLRDQTWRCREHAGLPPRVTP